MALVRWAPARDLQSIQQEMNGLFGTVFDSPTVAVANGVRRWVPAVDLIEEDGQYILRADLPGVSEDQVSVELEDDVLTISGERRSEQEERKEERKEGRYRIERASGRFVRKLTLPEGVDPEGIQADFDKGVLEVRIPKPEAPKPRRVAINVAGNTPATVDAAGEGASS
jgi:HSP20 family protein